MTRLSTLNLIEVRSGINSPKNNLPRNPYMTRIRSLLKNRIMEIIRQLNEEVKKVLKFDEDVVKKLRQQELNQDEIYRKFKSDNIKVPEYDRIGIKLQYDMERILRQELRPSHKRGEISNDIILINLTMDNPNLSDTIKPWLDSLYVTNHTNNPKKFQSYFNVLISQLTFFYHDYYERRIDILNSDGTLSTYYIPKRDEESSNPGSNIQSVRPTSTQQRQPNWSISQNKNKSSTYFK